MQPVQPVPLRLVCCGVSRVGPIANPHNLKPPLPLCYLCPDAPIAAWRAIASVHRGMAAKADYRTTQAEMGFLTRLGPMPPQALAPPMLREARPHFLRGFLAGALERRWRWMLRVRWTAWSWHTRVGAKAEANQL